MSIQISKATGYLSNYVKSYWGMESVQPQGMEHVQRIVPNGLPQLIFYFEELPESMDSQQKVCDRVLLAGQQKSFYDLRVSGRTSLFSVIFQPHGLSAFFDEPVSEFYDNNIPLRFILKDVVQELETRLYEATFIDERIRITEEFLLIRLNKSRKKFEFQRINHSIRTINQRKGSVTVGELASGACLSRKQFERTFQNYVGSSPKQFLRAVRFQATIHEKSLHQHANLTQLTYLGGYYDQSHMNSEFLKLSGMTPKTYFAGCEVYSDYFGSMM